MYPEINDIIKKHVPEQLAAELKNYLSDFESLKEELAKTKKDLAHMTKLNDQNHKKVRSLEELSESASQREKRIEELKSLELKVEKDQRDLDIKLIKKENEMLKDSRSEIRNLVETVFRNRVVSENIFRNFPMPDQYGNTRTETETTDKTTRVVE